MGEMHDQIVDQAYGLEQDALQEMLEFDLEQERTAKHQYCVDASRVNLYAYLACYKTIEVPFEYGEETVTRAVEALEQYRWYSSTPWDALPPAPAFTVAMELLCDQARGLLDARSAFDALDAGDFVPWDLAHALAQEPGEVPTPDFGYHTRAYKVDDNDQVVLL